jgi:hypothetical protein
VYLGVHDGRHTGSRGRKRIRRTGGLLQIRHGCSMKRAATQKVRALETRERRYEHCCSLNSQALRTKGKGGGVGAMSYSSELDMHERGLKRSPTNAIRSVKQAVDVRYSSFFPPMMAVWMFPRHPALACPSSSIVESRLSTSRRTFHEIAIALRT